MASKVTFKITLTSDPKLPFKVDVTDLMTQHPELGLAALYSVCDISGSHSNIAEGFCCLGCDAMSLDDASLFQRHSHAHFIMESNSIEIHSMKQIVDSFCFLLDKYEHCEWMREATRSEIQNVLQCARDVESMYSVLETKHCVTAFENKLNEWHQLKYGITAHYKLQELAAACDMILSNFLTNSNVADEAVKYATTEYIQICGRDRFELLKENLICKAHTHHAVKNIIDELNTNCVVQKDVYTSTVGCELLRSIWRKYVQRGQTFIISNCIQTACTDSRFLDSVLRLLVKEDFSEEDNIIKKMIKESLVLKMSALNERDPAFWYTLVVDNKSSTVAVCDLYPEICSVFLKFVSYIGNSMVVEFTESNCIWRLAENTKLIADVTFDDLVSLVRCFLESQGLAGKHMRQTLQDLKSQPDCSVWVEVERQCGLPVLAKCFIASSSTGNVFLKHGSELRLIPRDRVGTQQNHTAHLFS